MTRLQPLLEGKARYILILMILIGVGTAFWLGVERLKVDTDITSALPGNDPVVNSARRILRHHPVLENVFIQIGAPEGPGNQKALVEAGDFAAGALAQSGLVKVLSGKEGAGSFASLLEIVTENLPVFFGRAELEEKVRGLTRPDRVRRSLRDQFHELADVGSIGQTGYLAKDPLGLRNLVLARFSPPLLFQGASVHQGHILSRDGRHLLLVAEPRQFSQDAAFAHRLTETLEGISVKLPRTPVSGTGALTMVYTGAFRASLDNERIIKRDTSRALTLVTIGLIPLAFLSFRRTWLGILSFVPAMAGTMLAVFVYAFTRDSIFAVTMGFGGALIGIAVDHGMAYVILLDRPFETRGWAVAREVWSVSAMTVVSTIIALLSLAATGIPLFTQLGIFSALGVGLSALFVHVFFPILFPRLKGSRKKKSLGMERLMDRLIASSTWWTVCGFVAFAVVMVLFARVQFSANLESMNTVSRETREAERNLEAVWGGLPRKPCLMIEGATLPALWRETERLGEFLRREKEAGVLDGDPPRAALLPGPEEQETNLKDWREFWTRDRIAVLQASLQAEGARMGFKPEAFAPFFRILQEDRSPRPLIPEELFPFFGIFPQNEKGEGWMLADVIVPGPRYQGESFFRRAAQEGFLSFDSDFFSRHLTRELNRSFIRMLLIVGGVTLLVLFFYFLDWQLLLLAIAPVSFSFVATLGTLGLLGRPLSIPSLMLAPLILGLGLEQGLYLVRTFQRYGSAPDPNSDAFRVTILVCSVTTLIGFASLLFSEHAVLRDAGISSFLGIFYATAGAFGILPPFLRYLFSSSALPSFPVSPGAGRHRRLALRRYKHLEAYPRLFAHFKMLLDPMFPRLAHFVKPGWKLIDVGCGYAAPAVWLLEIYPDLKFLACDPDERRARIAGRVLGEQGEIRHCRAQDLPLKNERADAILLLDVIHYFSDFELREFLDRLRPVLSRQGKIIIRVTIPELRFSLFRLGEEIRLRLKGMAPNFRTREQIVRILEEAHFKTELLEPTASGREETWVIASSGARVDFLN